MLIDREIYSSYEEQIESASKEQVADLDDEVGALCSWGERWSGEVTVPQYATKTVMRFYEVDSRISEIEHELFTVDVEGANRLLWSPLDDQIVRSFKTVKAIGFSRPSTVLCGRMFYRVFSEKNIDLGPQEWCGLLLVLRRMWSTTRITIRFSNSDRFGKRTVHHKDGSVSFIYGVDQWRNMLVKRKIIPKGR